MVELNSFNYNDYGDEMSDTNKQQKFRICYFLVIENSKNNMNKALNNLQEKINKIYFYNQNKANFKLNLLGGKIEHTVTYNVGKHLSAQDRSNILTQGFQHYITELINF